MVVGLAASPPAQLYFRANRVRYLVNTHQYQQAFSDYDRLTADFEGAAARLPDFEAQTAQQAHDHYLDPLSAIRNPQSAIDYSRLLDDLEQRSALAPMARRMRLEAMTRVTNEMTTGPARAARAILNHEGYDHEALWWVALEQYNPDQPLEIPPEVIEYRHAIESPLEVGGEPSERQILHTTFFRALIALNDGDWAGAAHLFERNQERSPGATPFALAHGLALLRSGRPDAAIAPFEQALRAHPDHAHTLAYLCEAYLAGENYPGAAQTLDAARRMDSALEPEILERAFPGAGRTFSALLKTIGRDGLWRGDVALWGWIEGLIQQDPTGRRTLFETAQKLIDGGGLDPTDRATILQACLRNGKSDLIDRLIQSPQATASPDLAAVRRLAAWYPQREQAGAASGPLWSDQPGLLLTRSETKRIPIEMPRGDASILLLMVQGFPSGDGWPIIHVDLGTFGERTYYVHHSRMKAVPLLLALRPQDAGRMPAPQPDSGLQTPNSIEASISLLNAESAAGEQRNVVITQIYVF